MHLNFPYGVRDYWHTKMHIQWNPINMDTNGTCHSVRVNQVSVLSGLNLEKIYELLFHWKKRNCPLYPGVGIRRVSVERGSTVSDTYPNFLVLCSFMSIMKYS